MWTRLILDYVPLSLPILIPILIYLDLNFPGQKNPVFRNLSCWRRWLSRCFFGFFCIPRVYPIFFSHTKNRWIAKVSTWILRHFDTVAALASRRSHRRLAILLFYTGGNPQRACQWIAQVIYLRDFDGSQFEARRFNTIYHVKNKLPGASGVPACSCNI